MRATEEGEDFNYGSVEYWDNRYKKDGEDSYYDWLGDYHRFKEHVVKAAGDRRDIKILDLGCGNARLTENMFDDGYKDITAIDISPFVIEIMRKRNADTRPEIRWSVGDVFALDFKDETFDLIIDKSTMDAVACDEDKINENMVRMTGEVQRVLRTGGTYLVFSAVRGLATGSLQLPFTSFDFTETNIPMPFSELNVYAAKKLLGASVKHDLKFQGALEYGIRLDKHLAQQKREKMEAEERLKNEAPSSFGVLD